MTIKPHLKTFALTILMTCMLIPAASSAKELPGKGISVQPGRATWTTGFFLEALYSRALEDLGYEVDKAKDLSNPIFYQSVCQGDVDFWANGWFPLHNEQLPDDFDQKAEIAGYAVKAGALQGYLVSRTEVEKYDITSLDDFKRPEVKKAFDANGDGKADLVACPPGWGCEKVITHHLNVYDLEEHINPIKAGYSAGMADALARYRNGEPVFFFTWTPNWTIFQFKPGEDVMWVNVPENMPTEGQKAYKDKMTMSGVKGAVSDPIKMGLPANDIAVVASRAFLNENPAAARLFEVMSVPLEDIAAQNNRMFKGEDSPQDIESHVDEWIQANRDTWDGWLNEAIAAAQ